MTARSTASFALVLALSVLSDIAMTANAQSTEAVATTSHAITVEDYPPESILLGEQGTVSIDFIINVDGIVTECGVAQTSGKTRLDQAACQLVIRRWRYKPAMQDGKPVRVRTTANIAFQLTGIPQREALAHAAVNRGDYATAITIWRPLAEQGDPTARTVLGVLYANGEGVAQDYAEAARWYQLAAWQGYRFAQFSLGLLYESGRGVPENPVKAAMWFTLASSRADIGIDAGQHNERLRQRMTRPEIREVDAMVARCRRSRFSDC